MALPASAVPFLQLDTYPGRYVAGQEESIEATANPFRLFTLVNSLGGDNGTGNNANPAGFLNKTYYLSAAISPKQAFGNTGFGSFSINGVTYSAANMAYGVPPLETFDSISDSHDLAKHGQFPTYFIEIAFSLYDSVAGGYHTADLYNTQDDPGGPTDNPAGPLYYRSWDVNVTGLASDLFDVHFDLYTVKTLANGDRDVDAFAPFSHDAFSGPHTETSDSPEVPDASHTIILLGLALLGLVGFQYRLSHKAA